MLECNMLSADWILLRIVLKSNEARHRRRRKRGLSVYDQFHVSDSKADKQAKIKSRPHSLPFNLNTTAVDSEKPKMASIAVTTPAKDISTTTLNEVEIPETEVSNINKNMPGSI